jgi:hypothetical protein
VAEEGVRLLAFAAAGADLDVVLRADGCVSGGAARGR